MITVRFPGKCASRHAVCARIHLSAYAVCAMQSAQTEVECVCAENISMLCNSNIIAMKIYERYTLNK